MRYRFRIELMDRQGEIDLRTGSKPVFVIMRGNTISVGYFEPVEEIL